MAIEDVVAQHHRTGRAGQKLAANQKGLGQALRPGLHRIRQAHAPLRSIAQELLKARRVLGRADHEHFANTCEHQRRQRVVHHGLVIHRQQLLGDGQRGRMQAGAGAPREDDALAGGRLEGGREG